MKRALVIGCGGTIGGAWIVAALHALQEQTGWDPREASVLQGTSAGEALRASWGVPGWMPPVSIGDRKFVDGGAASTASVDLISHDDADLIYVITPMASESGVRAPGLGGLIEHRLLRRPMSKVLDAEVATARARGIEVVVIQPDAADLAGLGANVMLRSKRRAAVESAMTTAPKTVRRAWES